MGDTERGSLIVAVTVLMVVVALISVLSITVMGNQLVVLSRQNTSTGIAAADAGLSDALFRIDQIQQYPPTYLAPGCFVVTSGTPASGCSKVGSGVSGLGPGASAKYVATYNAGDTWTILAAGTVHGATAAVSETLSRSAQYPYAIFGNSGLTFDGRSSGNVGTYTPGLAAGSENANGAVEIGSNGTISCKGGLTGNVSYSIWSGGGGVSNGTDPSCQSASTANLSVSPKLYNLVIPATPSTATPCPNSCALGSGNSYPTLAGGIYYYNHGISLNGTLSVTGPVQIYQTLATSDPAYTGTAIGITQNSAINYAPAPATLPDATNLEIFSNSAGNVGDNSGLGYTFSGLLFAPDASLTQNGCKSVYYGALFINTLTCNGGPNLTVWYDANFRAVMGPWQTSDFAQIAPSMVNP